MREVQAENSEIKAKQLMNAFQSQGLQGSGTLSLGGLGDDGAEVQKLRTQLSSKTNEILQLQEDKEELELKLDDLRQQNEALMNQEGRGEGANNLASSNHLGAAQSPSDLNKSAISAKKELNMSLDQDQHETLLQQIEQSQQNAKEKEEEIHKMHKHNQELE